MGAETKGTERGRPRKAGPPPARGDVPASLAARPVVSADDLQALALAAQLEIKIDRERVRLASQTIGVDGSDREVLAHLAELLEESLAQAMWLAARSPSPQDARRRDWCLAVSAQAHDLATALGVTSASPTGAVWDSFATLKRGLALGDSPDALRNLVPLAVPGVADKDAVLNMIGRLGPGLEALSMFAQAAVDEWDPRGRRGGKNKDEIRHFVMVRLVLAYECCFSRKPSVSVKPADGGEDAQAPGPDNKPTGPCFRWFHEFFSRMERFLCEFPEGDAGAAALRQIAKGGIVGSGFTLVNWLREASGKQTKEQK